MAIRPGSDEFIRDVRPILETGDLEILLKYLHRHWSNPLLCDLLSCPCQDARKVALFCLSLVGTNEDCPAIAVLLRHEDAYIVRLAEHTLWSIWLHGKTPAAQARLREAVLMIAQDRLQEATDRLCTLIGDYPDFAEAYNQRAIAEFLVGQYDHARQDLHEALRLNPLHFSAIAGLGHCDAAEGFCDQALEHYRQALEIHPQVDGLRQAIDELQQHLSRADEKSPFSPDGRYPLSLD